MKWGKDDAKRILHVGLDLLINGYTINNSKNCQKKIAHEYALHVVISPAAFDMCMFKTY